jgi:hypothetical protein
MITPAESSDHGRTVGTPPGPRPQATAPQPDFAAQSRRRDGCQERAVRPRRRRPRRGDLDSRISGATITEVRWEDALVIIPDPAAQTVAAGWQRPPARTPAQPGTDASRSSLRTATNQAPDTLQRWVENCDRSVANSETPQRLPAGQVAARRRQDRPARTLRPSPLPLKRHPTRPFRRSGPLRPARPQALERYLSAADPASRRAPWPSHRSRRSPRHPARAHLRPDRRANPHL